MGTPKGLLRDDDGTPWVLRAAHALRDGGCERVVVVVGAAASQVEQLVPDWAQVVVAPDWAEGMGASLRAGLTAAAEPEATSTSEPRQAVQPEPRLAVVTLVDLPGVGAPVVARLLETPTATDPHAVDALMRASYDGVPGHPVVLGRSHWEEVARSARGDAGARAYLREREVVLIECGDIGHGDDVDTPD